MKIKTILQASLMMTLVGMCQPQPRAFTPELLAMLRPSPAPLPDLTVVAAYYKDPNVTVRLRNAGEVPAPPSVLAVLLRKKTDPDTGQPEAFQFPVPALSPGQMIQKTFMIGNKSFTNNGALAVVVDYKNQIAESNEANNKQTIKVAVHHLPDLVIQSVEITNYTATAYVFNKCTGSADPAKLDMTIYKGADKKSGWESILGADVPLLAGNTGAKIIIDLKKYPSVSTTSFGGRHVRLEVDRTEKIKETVESNNWWETGAAPFPDPANSCEPPK